MSNNFLKPIQSLISTKHETVTQQNITNSGLTYTLCSKSGLTSTEANYFVSFNLPHYEDVLLSGSSLAQSYPEIFQLNTDNIVIVPIPQEYYNEIIDGRSITFEVPQDEDSSNWSSKTIVSSTYNVLEKKSENVMLGKNIAFLFCDEINLPYTGETSGGAISKASQTTWQTNSYLDRPAATSYQSLQNSDINTDQRPWVDVNLAVPVPESYPTNTNQGYNYDIPVGFAALDKGFMVLTHPDIVNNIPWLSGNTLSDGLSNVGGLTKDIFFPSGSSLTFMDLDINYKTSVVCMALPNEFYFTNNPTWNFEENLQEYTNGTNNYEPTFVTEVGLYNKNQELIAIAKLDRAKEKGYVGVLTFTLQLDV